MEKWSDSSTIVSPSKLYRLWAWNATTDWFADQLAILDAARIAFAL